MDELEVKLRKYIENAKPSFDDIRVVSSGGDKVKDTALRYYSDAAHFMSRGEFVNAFAALEYAEGWLDCGIVAGLVKAPGKDPDKF